MSTKYEAFDASGKRHTRITAGRTYTHCVVFHIPPRTEPIRDEQGREVWPTRPGYDKTSWAGSLALAEKAARGSYYKHLAATVEIIEAQVQEGKR